MFNYQNVAVKLAASLAIVLIHLCYVLPANAVTQKLQINSDNGYRVETTFSYDAASHSGAITEQGKGATQAIDNLTVSFYDPSGSMIANYDNIVDGIAQGNYFEFNYDPATQKLLGEIDLGGEFVGEIYLKGNVDQELFLIMLKPSGEEVVIDQLLVINY